MNLKCAYAGDNTQAAQTVACSSHSSTRVPSKLVKPVEIGPVTLQAPVGHGTSGCMKASKNSFSWEIIGFEWRTGAHLVQNMWIASPPDTYVPAPVLRLNISNTATNHSVFCHQISGSASLAGLPPDANLSLDEDWNYLL